MMNPKKWIQEGYRKCFVYHGLSFIRSCRRRHHHHHPVCVADCYVSCRPSEESYPEDFFFEYYSSGCQLTAEMIMKLTSLAVQDTCLYSELATVY